jgi:hypothetical protein
LNLGIYSSEKFAGGLLNVPYIKKWNIPIVLRFLCV